MTDPRPNILQGARVPDDLVGPPSGTGLAVFYSILAIYGILGSIFGITTLVQVGGVSWGIFWPTALAVLSMLALVGVARSQKLEKYALEITTALLLIGLLAGYAITICFVALHPGGDINRLPGACLPILVTVFPFFRLVNVSRWVK